LPIESVRRIFCSLPLPPLHRDTLAAEHAGKIGAGCEGQIFCAVKQWKLMRRGTDVLWPEV
jgi:hypothetical protein